MPRSLRLLAVLALAAGCAPTPVATDPCASAQCGAGRCVLDRGYPLCLCDEGFAADGLTCVRVDLCSPNPCVAGGRTACTTANGAPVCACPANRLELGGACVPRTPCTPNPCTALHQSACTVVGDFGRCDCDPGYAPLPGGGCSTAPVWSCATTHSGEDGAEPDECPALASTLTPGPAAPHTLAPEGDQDWFSVPTVEGHVMRVTVDPAGSTVVVVEVFRPDRVSLVSSASSQTALQASFLADAAGPWFLRVRALRANATGSYSILIEDLGADDYTDRVDQALPISAGADFAGAVQYPGDLDVVQLTVPELTSVSAGTDGGANTVLEVLDRTGAVLATANGTVTVFGAPGAGPLYLRARGRSPATVSAFDYATLDLGPDDYADVPAFAVALQPSSQPRSGVFERPTDVDVSQFNATAGHVYQFATNGALPVTLQFVDAAGVSLATTGYYGTSVLGWKATASGPVYALTTQPYAYGGPRPYTFRLEDVGPDDYGDDAAHATPLTPGATVSGRFELNGDVDAFSFSTTASHIYQVGCTSPAGGYGCTVTVLAPGGQPLGQGTTVSFLATSALSATALVTGNIGTWTLSVTDTGTDDHGNTAATGTPLTPGSAPVGGAVQYAGDLDVFTFPAVAGRIYAVDCVGSAFSMAVKDPSGVQVGSSMYGGASVSFKAAVGGTYSVEIGNQGYGSYTGSYTVAVRDLGLDDYGDTAASAAPLALGTSMPGTLSYQGDVDVFAAGVTSGRIYRVSCAATASVCGLQVKDPSGTVVGGNPYPSAAATVSFLAALTGSYTIFVSAAAYGSGGATGNYTISVSDIGTDDHGDTAATATALTVGAAPVVGNIQYAGDIDAFSFPGVADRIMRVACATSSSVCGLDVQSAQGVSLASASGGYSTQLAFKVPASGTLVARVSGGYSNTTGGYTIAVTDVGVDDHGDTLATATPLTLGTAMPGVIDYAADADWFTIALAAGAHSVTVSGSVQATLRTQAGAYVTSVYGPTSFTATAQTYSLEVRGYGPVPASYTVLVQ